MCSFKQLYYLKDKESYDKCSKILLTVPRRYFFCGSFMFLFCLVFAMFCARLFICALWSPAGIGLTSWLSFVVSSVSLSLSHWYPGSGVVLDCIDSWSLQPYYFEHYLWNCRRQIAQTQIRLLLKQSDQSLPCLIFWQVFREIKP